MMLCVPYTFKVFITHGKRSDGIISLTSCFTISYLKGIKFKRLFVPRFYVMNIIKDLLLGYNTRRKMEFLD